MKKLVIILVIIAAITGLVASFLQGRKELTADAEGDKPIAVAPDVKLANGETVVSLNQDRQKLIGVETAGIKTSALSPEIKAYGRVLDSQPLVGLLSDIASARVSLDASSKEYDRSKTLFDQGENASAKTLQAAEAAMKRDQIALRAAKAQLTVAWGEAIARQPNLPALVESLATRETALVELDLPTGQLLTQGPAGGQLLQPGADVSVEGRFLGRAAMTDRQTQGEGFLFIATNFSGGLTPGLALTGLLQLRGEPLRGVIMPETAIVRWAGNAWVYVETSATNFTRREIILDHPTEGGWFLTNGVAPGDRVVTTGAQALLSEERKAEIRIAD